jgi:hypothetical protein
MKQPEEILQNDFLRETLGATSTICPSPEFSANVMRAVEAEAVQQALLSAPLISRQVWQRLGFGIGVILLFPFIIGFLTATSWSEFVHTITSFTFSQSLIASASQLGFVDYLPKLVVITIMCTLILLADKLFQRYQSK